MTLIVIMSIEIPDRASARSRPLSRNKVAERAHYAVRWSDVLHKCNQTQYCAELVAGTRQFAWRFIA